MNDVLYVIPAKRLSRRFPGKNRLVFQGSTLLRRTLDDIGDTLDRVVVISDDDELLDEAGAAGCRTLREPEPLTLPGVSAWAAASEAVRSLAWMQPEIVCLVHLNVINRPAGTVQRLVRELRENPALRAAIPVERVPDRWHPAYMLNLPEMHWVMPDECMLATERLTPIYASSLAAAYAVRTKYVDAVAAGGWEAIREAKFRAIAGVIVPTGMATEIDTREDYERALD